MEEWRNEALGGPSHRVRLFGRHRVSLLQRNMIGLSGVGWIGVERMYWLWLAGSVGSVHTYSMHTAVMPKVVLC